jgi:hypothetical protein
MTNLSMYKEDHILSDDRFKRGDIIYVDGQFGWNRGKYEYYSSKPPDYMGKYPQHVHICNVYFEYYGWDSAIYDVCISEAEFLEIKIRGGTSFVDVDKLRKLFGLQFK